MLPNFSYHSDETSESVVEGVAGVYIQCYFFCVFVLVHVLYLLLI